MSDCDSVRVLFVGGMPRSGSTLFDLMAGQLPHHCDVGEVFYLWQSGVLRDELCACHRPFLECPFWTEVAQEAFGGWDALDVPRILKLQQEIDTTPAELRATFLGRRRQQDREREYAAVLRRLYAAIAKVSGAEVVVDSTKRPSTAALLAAADGIDLRIVQIVRDPRGVINSWSRQVALPAGTGPRDHLKKRRMSQILRRWLTVNLMTEWLGRAVPLLRIRYEDLVADPRAAMSAVLEHAGVEVGPEALSFIHDDGIDVGTSHAATGGRVRMRSGRMALRHDEAWRTELPRHRQLLTVAVAGALMKRYGYL